MAFNLVDIPLSIIESVLFTSIIYWMCGFAPEVGRFFLFMFIIFTTRIAMSAFFKAIAVVSPNDVAATGIGAICLLVFVLHSGYMLSQGDVKPYWIWAYWIDPLQYGMTALCLCEFKADRYSGLADPNNPNSGTLGDYFLSTKKITTSEFRLWIGIVFNLCFWLMMVILYAAALKFVKWPERFSSKAQATGDDEEEIPEVSPPRHLPPAHPHSPRVTSIYFISPHLTSLTSCHLQTCH